MKHRKNRERKAIAHEDAVKYPIAIREDNNVFRLAGFLPGFGRFVAFVRWASYAGPCCRNVFRRDFWPNNINLGDGQRTGAEFGHLFNDGSTEGNELGALGRLRAFCPSLLSGIWGGRILSGILACLQCYVQIGGMKRDQQYRFAPGISGNSD